MKSYADTVLVLNPDDKEQLIKKFHFLESKVIVVPGVVDKQFNDSLDRDFDDASYVSDACFVGRLHPQKGIEDLIQAWAYLNCNDATHKLVVIGWGPQSYTAKLKSLISHHQLGGCVRLIGNVNSLEKIRYMKGAKIIAFPSTKESFGIVALEGLTLGKRVVARPMNVLKHWFKDELTYAEDFSTKEYANALDKALHHSPTSRPAVPKALDIGIFDILTASLPIKFEDQKSYKTGS